MDKENYWMQRRDLLGMSLGSVLGMGAMGMPQSAAASLGVSPLVGIVSVKDYGAKGDGRTDDTTAIQTALTKAKELASTQGEAAVVLPNGRYRISKTLDLRDTKNISLIGMKAQILQVSPSETIMDIRDVTDITLRDIALVALNGHQTHAVRLNYSRRVLLDNIKISNVGGNCIWANDSWWLSARNCLFSGNSSSATVHHERNMNSVAYIHCRFHKGTDGIIHKHGAAVALIACDFSATETAINIEEGCNIEILNGYFEGNVNGIKWGNARLRTWPQCGQISNCYFITPSEQMTGIHIDIQRGTRLHMQAIKMVGNGNAKRASTTTGINIRDHSTISENSHITVGSPPYMEYVKNEIVDPGKRLQQYALQPFGS